MKLVIVEDEFPVRSALKKMLTLIAPEVEVIAECETVKEGVTVLQNQSPDLVFMDIELKDGVSFDILKQLENISFQIIFITAFNHYAIKAFKFSAIDYLLKPIDLDELQQAIAKAKTQIEQQTAYQQALLALQENLKTPQQLVVKTSDNRYVIPMENLIRFEADGAYTHLYYTNGQILCSKNLKHYESLLPENTFFRCHQSHLIRIQNIIQLSKDSVVLSNEDVVPVSHRRKQELKKLLSG